MHDSLAACITVTKQFLAGDLDGVDAAVILQEWEKSIAFRDAVLLPAKEKLLDSARSSGVTVRFNGGQPTGRSAELVYIAMQVCLNNAIQYAQATELTASLWNIGDCCNVVIHNNGKAPEGPITEGGGLTNLRRRVERVGGTMTVQSIPEFALVLRIPNYGIAGGNEWL